MLSPAAVLTGFNHSARNPKWQVLISFTILPIYIFVGLINLSPSENMIHLKLRFVRNYDIHLQF